MLAEQGILFEISCFLGKVRNMFDSMEDIIYVADYFVEHFPDGELDYSFESLRNR